MDADRKATLDALRHTIADIERHPPLAEAAGTEASMDGALVLPSGCFHEIRHPHAADQAAADAFALLAAASWRRPGRPAVIHLHLRRGEPLFGLPYAHGLAPIGLPNRDLVIGRLETVEDLLWACEQASTSRAVAGIVLDLSGHRKPLDFTSGRRLSLRAAEHGCGIAMVRHGSPEGATGAGFRWSVSSAPSLPKPYDDKAPGAPCWSVRLEKGNLPGMVPGSRITVSVEDGTMVPVAAARAPDGAVPVSRSA
jgi:Uncharacterized conserved protein